MHLKAFIYTTVNCSAPNHCCGRGFHKYCLILHRFVLHRFVLQRGFSKILFFWHQLDLMCLKKRNAKSQRISYSRAWRWKHYALRLKLNFSFIMCTSWSLGERWWLLTTRMALFVQNLLFYLQFCALSKLYIVYIVMFLCKMSINHSLVLTDFGLNIVKILLVQCWLKTVIIQTEHYLYIQCMVEVNSGCTVIIQEQH